MQDYKQIDIEISNHENEIERLKAKCEELAAARQKIAEAELAEAVEKVIALGGYATMEPPKSTVSSRSPSSGPKKYLNPEDSKEWSGQGYMPEWILNGDKEKFINPAWTAYQAAKKQPKKNQAKPELQSLTTTQPREIESAEAQTPLVASLPAATTVQPNVIANKENPAQPDSDVNSEKTSTEHGPAASVN